VNLCIACHPAPSGPSITDWIIAITGVLVAIGTIGAVVVALFQIRRQERRSLIVSCSAAFAAITAGQVVGLVVLTATNNGSRPVKITQAYLQTEDGQMIFVDFTNLHGQPPQLLIDGESFSVSWEQDRLEAIAAQESAGRYLYAFFTDSVGRIYPAPMPGIEKVSRRLVRRPWKKEISWVPTS
jgi:hypothetical protein